MRVFRAWFMRFTSLFKKTRLEQELADEIESNLQFHIDDNARAGMTPEEARRAALVKLGGIESLKDSYRDRRGIPVVESIVQDVRFALRSLRKNPGFSLVAIATLTLGIGFNSALFTIVDAAVFRPLKVREPGRLADIYTSDRNGEIYATSSHPDYLDLKAGNEVFSDIVGYTPASAALRVDGQSRLALGEAVTGNYFRVLGINAIAGRTLLPEDDRPDAPRAAVISYRLWNREFGASPGVVGRSIRIGGQLYTVVGVIPREFTGMFPVLLPEVWLPVVWMDDIETVGIGENLPSPGNTLLERRGNRFMFMRGRLKEGQTVERAAANVRVIMEQLARKYPETNKDRRFTLVKTSDVHIHPLASQPLQIAGVVLMLLVGLVLLIACSNVAGMLLARASWRRKEFGIRLAIGAGRGRLIQQLLTESILMSSIGAAAAVGFAWALVRTAGSAPTPIGIPVGLDLQLDRRVLFFTAAVAMFAGLAAGLLPALRATRAGLIAEVKGTTAAHIERRRWTLRDGLVVMQIAVTFVFLVMAGLLGRGAAAMQRMDLGFRTEGIATLGIPLNVVGYNNTQARQFYDRAIERVRTVPGVESAALAWRLPLSQTFSQDSILLPGGNGPDDKSAPIETTAVSPGYFATLDVPILQGRDFVAADTPTSSRVAIINETMARRFWPGKSAVGERFRVVGRNAPEYEIVGVSADYKVRTPGELPTPYIHSAISQGRVPSVILARTRGDAGALAATIRRELLELDPNLLFSEPVQTLQEHVAATSAPARLAALSMSVFGAVAMTLTAVGLYGVIAYLVARRTQEIGVRLALGARPGAVVWLVIRRGLTVVGVGVLVGMPLALGAAQVMSAALYGVSPLDPLAWGAAAAVMLCSALAANAVPARRAARLDPSVALRSE